VQFEHHFLITALSCVF